jgi:hypothetical protein
MASAGVVGMAEVIQPNATTQSGLSGSVAMWSFVWVGLSALFLMFVHVAMLGRR